MRYQTEESFSAIFQRLKILKRKAVFYARFLEVEKWSIFTYPGTAKKQNLAIQTGAVSSHFFPTPG